ncbi:unnamed protein product, partial [Rotaria magnacalcarata]
KKTRLYLESNRIFKWLENHSKNSKNAASGRGNQAYVLAATSIYDDWVRNNYELQVWQAYLKLATEKKHWAKEVVQQNHSKNSKNAASGRGNQAYVLAATSIYDDWVRNNYELQVWQAYLKLATEKKHWAKEVVQRTKRRDDVLNTRFVQKKINQLTSNISEASAAISDLQIQLSTYWM